MNEEMLAKRSSGTQTWWRSHYHTKCACLGCKGEVQTRETDPPKPAIATRGKAAGSRANLSFVVQQRCWNVITGSQRISRRGERRADGRRCGPASVSGQTASAA